MKDLFMSLLGILGNYGKLTSAVMYKSGDWSSITIEAEDGVYEVSIRKEEVKENA